MRLSAVSISKSLGVSRQAVDKAIKRGRIDPNKPIEQIKLDWERNADPLQRSRRMGSVTDRAMQEQAVRRAPVTGGRTSVKVELRPPQATVGHEAHGAQQAGDKWLADNIPLFPTPETIPVPGIDRRVVDRSITQDLVD